MVFVILDIKSMFFDNVIDTFLCSSNNSCSTPENGLCVSIISNVGQFFNVCRVDVPLFIYVDVG